MSIDNAIFKFEEATKRIRSNKSQYDPKLVNNLVNEIMNRLPDCLLIDQDLVNFLSDRKNFNSLTVLSEFVKSKVGICSSKTRKKDAVMENARILTQKGVNITQLIFEFPKSEEKAQKKASKPKRDVPDMSKKWISMNEAHLLTAFKEFKTGTELKQAAGNLLKSSDKRLRKREYIEQKIIDRIKERKSFFRLGH